MPDKIQLQVNPRKVIGRKVKQLRRQGIVPGNIYGKDVKSLAVEMPLKDLQTAFAKAGETSIIYLSLKSESKPRPVLIHNLHRHPVTADFLHVDFHQVDLTKTVTVDIPVELTGEAPAVSQGGVLVQLINEIEVEALPTDLPEKFVLDVSQLGAIGQGLTLKDIKLDQAKIKFTSDNLDELIVQIEEPTKEEAKPAEPEPAEGEAGEAGEAAEPTEGKATEAKEEAKPAEGKPVELAKQPSDKGKPAPPDSSEKK